MKRNFILVCVSALVLALGLSVAAGADVSAKPAAKKAKSCKKKGGKGKAGKSAAATAQAKKKGKGKSCKAKPKGKAGDKAAPAPLPTPAPTSPAVVPFGDGIYKDAATTVELNVSGGATTVVLKYVPPGFCAGVNYTSQPVALTKSGSTWTANETRSFSIIGEPANVKWDLTVKDPGPTYALNLTLESNSLIGLCKGEGHPTGTLTKVG